MQGGWVQEGIDTAFRRCFLSPSHSGHHSETTADLRRCMQCAVLVINVSHSCYEFSIFARFVDVFTAYSCVSRHSESTMFTSVLVGSDIVVQRTCKYCYYKLNHSFSRKWGKQDFCSITVKTSSATHRCVEWINNVLCFILKT